MVKELQSKISNRIYEMGYDLWLKVGFRLFFIEILFNTKDWVLYEYFVDGNQKVGRILLGWIRSMVS